MTRSMSPMYCRLNAISGFSDEKVAAELMLERFCPGYNAVAILGTEDEHFIYGQSNFKLDVDDEYDFKFIDRFATISTNGVLDALNSAGRPKAILFMDADVRARFDAHPAFRRVRALFRDAHTFAGAPGRASPTFFGRAASRLSGLVGLQPSAGAPAGASPETMAARVDGAQTLAELIETCFFFDFDCALDLYESALTRRVERDPRDATALTARGLLRVDLGSLQEGLNDLRRGYAEGGPDLCGLWLAKAAWRLGQPQEAVDRLPPVSSINRRWSRRVRSAVHVLRGLALYDLGRPGEAVIAFQEALDHDGSQLGLHLWLARALSADGRHEDALAAVDDAIVIDPNVRFAHVAKCALLQGGGRRDELKHALGKLRSVQGGDFEATRFEDQSDDTSRQSQAALLDLDILRHRALGWSALPTWRDANADQALAILMSVSTNTSLRGSEHEQAKITNASRAVVREPLDASCHAALGASHFLAGQRDAGAFWMEQAVALGPEDERWHEVLVHILRVADRYVDALAASNRAQKLEVVSDNLKFQIRDLLFEVPENDVLDSLADRSPEPLMQLSRERLEAPRTRPAALSVMARIWAASDKDAALKALKEAVELDPTRVHYRVRLAELLEGSGLLEESEAQEAEILRLHRAGAGPGNEASDVTGAKLLAELGRSRAAMAEFERILVCASSDPDALLGLGQLLIAADQAERGLRCLEQAAATGGHAALEAARALSEWFGRQHRTADRVKAARRLCELDPHNAEACLDLGYALYVENEYDAAVAQLRRGLELDPRQGWGWGILGSTLLALELPSEAVEALTRSRELRPDIGWSRGDLTDALILAGRRAEALAMVEEALASDPSEARMIELRLELLDAAGAEGRA